MVGTIQGIQYTWEIIETYGYQVISKVSFITTILGPHMVGPNEGIQNTWEKTETLGFQISFVSWNII